MIWGIDSEMAGLSSLRIEDVKDYETPCFMISKKVIKEQFTKIRKVADQVAYSFKTNPDKSIALFLKALGSTFSVSSVEEARVLKEAVGDLSDAFYVNPAADEEEFKRVSGLGIRRFVLNSRGQLKELEKSGAGDVRVLLRLNTGVRVKGVYGNRNLGMKKDELIEAAVGLKRIGLHNHLATQNNDFDSWKANLNEICLVIKRLKEKGVDLDVLNLGGGFPIDYLEKAIPFDELSGLLQEKLGEIRKSYPGISVVFESGRFIIGPAAALITQVVGVDKGVVYVNDSLYNSHMDTLIAGLELPCYALARKPGKTKAYSIRGNTPDSLDFFRRKAELQELSKGNYVIFTNAGAYNFSSDFLGKKKNKVYIID